MRFHSPTLLASLMFAASATARFVMYYDEWHPSRPTSAEDRAGIDHVIIAFAPSNETAIFTPKVSVDTLRSEFPNAKIMIAVGGWGDVGGGFSLAAKTDDGMAAFAKNISTMLTNTTADGVDIDWEYPGGNGIDYKQNPNADKAYEIPAFPKMLKAIRTAIGEDKLLSIAVPGKTGDMLAYTAETGPDICGTVDYVNVMSYDLVNRRDLVTGHHTSVNGTKAAIQAYLDIGCDAQKLNLGYAFYAKYFTTTGDCSSQPLGCAIVAAEDPTGKDTLTSGAWTFEKSHMQPFDASAITPQTDGRCGPDTMTKCSAGNCCSVDGWCGVTPEHCGGACWHAFGEGCTGPDVYASWQVAAAGGKTDTTAGGEYFFDPDQKLFWTWDTVELMKQKISDIVNPLQVGGVMAWSLGEDSDGWSHIKAIAEWVKQPGGGNMTSTPSGTPQQSVGGDQVSIVTVTKTVTATAYATPAA